MRQKIKMIVMRYAKTKRFSTLGIAIAFLFIAGCSSLFVSHYDAGTYEKITSLKAYHLKFLDDCSAGWDEARVKQSCDSGDLKFREAREYALGRNDQSRVKAIKYLSDEFKEECDLALSSKKPFSKAYLEEQRPMVEKNYNYAIQGELSRVGNPVK
jgi:hypothetical protein